MFSSEPTKANVLSPVKLHIRGRLILYIMPMSVFGKNSSGLLVTGLMAGNRLVVKKSSIGIKKQGLQSKLCPSGWIPLDIAYLMAVNIPIEIRGRTTKKIAKPHLRFNVRKFFLRSTLK
jgi:hypothetical protein